MSRQHARPVVLDAAGRTSALDQIALAFASDPGAVSEATIQEMIHSHAAILPVAEVDPAFSGPVAICRELNTPAGPIDNFLVTPSGMPVLVECKLWRNPEGRREVVGQILDYAKELSRWSSADLQREVNRRLGTQGNAILSLVRAAGHEVEEIAFNDALTFNLKRGRFLLLIVGDGIREGVEAIAEFLQRHANLHFSLGLVEMPVFRLPSGERLVTPRALSRVHTFSREAIALPDGMILLDTEGEDMVPIQDPDREALASEQREFWTEFLSGLELDDPEQPIPRAPRQGYITFMLPAPGGTSWLTVYRDLKANEVGVFLSSNRDSAGERARLALVEEGAAITALLGGEARVQVLRGIPTIMDSRMTGSLADATARREAFNWLRERTNMFVNVLRPRVRSMTVDFLQSGSELL